MQSTDVPNKTAAGYAEIQNRKLHLGARQRTLLISIDGAHTIQQVREQFRVLGDVTPLIEELHTAGLVHLNGHSTVASNDPTAPTLAPMASGSMHVMPPLGLVRQFMNETAVDAVGLRAFMFTLKLERCSTKHELIDVVPEYKRILGKARKADPGYADALASRAEAMLAAI
jgi:hypothetical protein